MYAGIFLYKYDFFLTICNNISILKHVLKRLNIFLQPKWLVRDCYLKYLCSLLTIIKCIIKVKEARRCYCCLSLENFYTDNQFERFFYFVNASMYLLLYRYASTTFNWYNNNKGGHELDCPFYTHWIWTVRYCDWYFFVKHLYKELRDTSDKY